MSDRLRVIVAGGGSAGLETLLALRELADDRVALTLLDPADAYVDRPMTVAEPFSVGHAMRRPFDALCRAVGARFVRAPLTAVQADAHRVRTTAGQDLDYDALVVTLGARAKPVFPHALTYDPMDADAVGDVVRDLEDGYARRVAILVPAGPHWPLPAYELARLLGRQARRASHDDAEITVVTPEPEPLAGFGAASAQGVAAEMASAGVRVEAGAEIEVRRGHAATIALGPGREPLEVDRVLALPELRPYEVEGLPDGFLRVDEHCRVIGVPDVYAAGDGTDMPLKLGGLAARQADAIAEHLAARAGADVAPQPFDASDPPTPLLVAHGVRLEAGEKTRGKRLGPFLAQLP